MRAKVVSNSCLKGSCYKLILKAPFDVTVLPGQFLMIRPGGSPGSSDPLLPRPFSIHRINPDGNIEVLYKVVGKGTSLLAQTEEGEEIGILGPLGNGFTIDSGDTSGEILIVAGGIGVAPMLGLAETLKTTCPGKMNRVFLGGRGEADLLCIEELKAVSTEVILATNDGSVGFKGYVTEALEKHLSRSFRIPHSAPRTTLYACGPTPMLQRILEITKPLNIETYFSLEANMACGIGVCMGCAVKKKGGGYYLVCKDGPVFEGRTVTL